MNFLDDDKIIKLITEYIKESKYDFAVMINGEWGSGKTYFIKNTLSKEIEKLIINTEKSTKNERFKVVYISLYGIENLSNISSQIYIKLMVFTGSSLSIFPLLIAQIAII